MAVEVTPRRHGGRDGVEKLSTAEIEDSIAEDSSKTLVLRVDVVEYASPEWRSCCDVFGIGCDNCSDHGFGCVRVCASDIVLKLLTSRDVALHQTEQRAFIFLITRNQGHLGIVAVLNCNLRTNREEAICRVRSGKVCQ